MIISKELELINTVFGQFYVFKNDLITKEIKKCGAHSRNELAMILSFIQPGDIVLDIGAHIGTFSVPIASKVGINGHVYAFEGCTSTFSALQKN